jgi:hypothetical protein
LPRTHRLLACLLALPKESWSLEKRLRNPPPLRWFFPRDDSITRRARVHNGPDDADGARRRSTRLALVITASFASACSSDSACSLNGIDQPHVNLVGGGHFRQVPLFSATRIIYYGETQYRSVHRTPGSRTGWRTGLTRASSSSSSSLIFQQLLQLLLEIALLDYVRVEQDIDNGSSCHGSTQSRRARSLGVARVYARWV